MYMKDNVNERLKKYWKEKHQNVSSNFLFGVVSFRDNLNFFLKTFYTFLILCNQYSLNKQEKMLLFFKDPLFL